MWGYSRGGKGKAWSVTLEPHRRAATASPSPTFPLTKPLSLSVSSSHEALRNLLFHWPWKTHIGASIASLANKITRPESFLAPTGRASIILDSRALLRMAANAWLREVTWALGSRMFSHLIHSLQTFRMKTARTCSSFFGSLSAVDRREKLWDNELEILQKPWTKILLVCTLDPKGDRISQTWKTIRKSKDNNGIMEFLSRKWSSSSPGRARAQLFKSRLTLTWS